jgi:hypothetical protein
MEKDEGKTFDDVITEFKSGKRKGVLAPIHEDDGRMRVSLVFEDWPWPYGVSLVRGIPNP